MSNLQAGAGCLAIILLAGSAGTPSLHAQLRADSADLRGVVLDAASGEPLRGAVLYLPSVERSVRTDGSGRFPEVRVPSGLLELAVVDDGYELFHRRLTVTGDADIALELTPLQGRPSSTGAVSGRVREAISGRPVPFASVEVLGGDASDLTDDEGHWHLRSVPAGTPILLVVSHLGHAPTTRAVTVPPDSTVEVSVGVEERVIPLAGIDVGVTNRILSTAGFYRRVGKGYNGRQWTVQEIAAADPDNLDDLLIDARGVRQVGSDGHWDAVGCDTLPIFINEMEMPPDYDLDMIDPAGVAAMEIYHGLRDIDVPTGYGCGAILIWLGPPSGRREPEAESDG